MNTRMLNREGTIVTVNRFAMEALAEFLMYFECEDGIWRHFTDVQDHKLKEKDEIRKSSV